jgi:hypothetical protein
MRADHPNMHEHQEYRCTHCEIDFWYKWELPGPSEMIHECPNCKTFIGIGYTTEDGIYCMPSDLARRIEKKSGEIIEKSFDGGGTA